jgi:hypothetical protein
MANPQNNKTGKSSSVSGLGTNAPQPQSSSPNPTPPSGYEQPGQSNLGSQGAGRTGTSGTSTMASGLGTGSTDPKTGSNIANTPSVSRPATGSDQPISDQIGDTASGILDKAKETVSGTYDAVATKATNKVEERKSELSTGLRTLADTFRKTGTDLKGAPQTTPLTDMTAQYTRTAANQIDKVASYFERKDLKAMMRDTESFARRNPAIFLGAAFALGMLAARFLKSSAPDAGSVNAGSRNMTMPTALPPADQPTRSANRST